MAISEQVGMRGDYNGLIVGKSHPGIMVTPRNRLLDSLLSQRCDLLRPYLKRVFLESRELLSDVDEPVTQFYFPQGTAVVSMMRLFQDGRASEMATLGNDEAGSVAQVKTASKPNLAVRRHQE